MSYDNFARTFSESRRDHPWPEIDSILADIKTRGYMSILDIGCGNGRFLEEVEKQWYIFSSYLGLDSSLGMIEEDKKLHPDFHFDVIDMTWLWISEIKNSTFDAILFLASFHHLQTYEERIIVLHEVRRFLAPGGRIYMTNWNLRDQERYKNSHQWGGDYSIKIGEYTRYYHGFTLIELEGLFSEAWYEIVENQIFDGGRNILSRVKVTEF